MGGINSLLDHSDGFSGSSKDKYRTIRAIIPLRLPDTTILYFNEWYIAESESIEGNIQLP